MNKKPYILALDIGTSSIKAALVDKDFHILVTEKVDYSYQTHGTYVQTEPEKIWKAFLKVIKKMAEDLSTIKLVVQCVFSPALIALDESGDPLYPAIIHWDRRSIKQAKKALLKIGKKKFLETAGNIPYPGGISVTSILWIKENKGEIFKKTFKFGHMNTFFAKRLTDNWSIDPTNASLTGLYNTVAYSGWSEEIARELEIPLQKLPPIVPSTKIVGKITKKAANITGIKSGTPLLMGANDTSSAAVGAGVLKNGQILNVSGSSEILTICLEKPIANEKYYLRTHPLPDRWLMFDITTGGFALEWFRSQFCEEMSEKNFYQIYLRKILEKKRKCRVKFNPHLAGDRTSLRQKTASFSGLTLSTTRDDCLYSLMEGTVGRMRKTLSKMAKLIKLDKTIYLTGGGANKVLMDYKKKIFPDFDFVVKENCSLQGCLYIAKMKLKK